MLRPLSVLLGEAHHLTHVNYDFRERQSVLLFFRHLRFHGEAQGIYE